MASVLSDHENNTLRAGSLLAVPPPAPGTQPLAGSMTVDLPGTSLTQWATHVQDVASGMRLPPEAMVNCPQVDIVGVLNQLEKMTMVRYCHLCFRVSQKCGCSSIPHQTPSQASALWMPSMMSYAAMRNRRAIEWMDIKELSPLKFMPYVAEPFKNVTGKDLKGLSDFTGWIGLRGYYHWKLAQLGQLQACPCLQGHLVPEGPIAQPSSQPHPQRLTQTGTPATGASGRHQEGSQLTSDRGGKKSTSNQGGKTSTSNQGGKYPTSNQGRKLASADRGGKQATSGAWSTHPRTGKEQVMVHGEIGTKGPSGGLKGECLSPKGLPTQLGLHR